MPSADEEALRQLLADPAARAELLAVFPRPAVRLWRRPAFVGLAAGLFLLVTTSMVLLRRGQPPTGAHPSAGPGRPGGRQGGGVRALSRRACPALRSQAEACSGPGERRRQPDAAGGSRGSAAGSRKPPGRRQGQDRGQRPGDGPQGRRGAGAAPGRSCAPGEGGQGGCPAKPCVCPVGAPAPVDPPGAPSGWPEQPEGVLGAGRPSLRPAADPGGRPCPPGLADRPGAGWPLYEYVRDVPHRPGQAGCLCPAAACRRCGGDPGGGPGGRQTPAGPAPMIS